MVSVGLWQATQLVPEVGKCVAFCPVAPPLPAWQVTQLVAPLNPLWLGLAPNQLAVEVWQDSQPVVTPVWMAVDGFAVTPGPPFAWQLWQPVEMLWLLCTRPGNQDA